MIRSLMVIFTIAAMSVAQAQHDDDFLLMVPAMLAAQKLGSKPGPSNTGATGPLQASGGFTIKTAGAIIKDLEITGCLNVDADNVRIQNVRINCNSFYGIRIVSDRTGTVIEDVEIYGMRSAGVFGSDFTLRRANIHDSGNDAVKPGRNVVIENSWFHRLGSLPDAHADGVQMVSGGNVIIRANNFDMPYFLSDFRNSQCMIIQTNNGPIDNVLIEKNWLNGGGYCVQINDKGNGYGGPTNVRIIDNQFGRDCQFGILRFRNTSVELSGNTYEDTGEPIGDDFTICGNDL